MSLLDAYNKAMAQLRADVNDVVHNDMRDGIAIAMVYSARTRVYDAYSPKKYERRWTLTDPSHYRFTPIDLGVEVESPIMGNPAYAPPASSGWNPGYISHIIESGDGYPWLSKGSDMDRIGPRPYLTEGMKDYVNTRANSDLADGLRARGYIVE
jgi:hypothetical protein